MPEILTHLRQLNREIDRVGDDRRAAERRLILRFRDHGSRCLIDYDVITDADLVRAKHLEGNRLEVERIELRKQLRGEGALS